LPFFFRDLAKAKKLNDNSLARKAHKVMEYESIVPPRRSDVWKLAQSETLKQKLAHPRLRHIFQEISENPTAVKKYMSDPEVSPILVDLMKQVDTRYFDTGSAQPEQPHVQH
jgi:hypothetical protein